jgi:hypothetical protein
MQGVIYMPDGEQVRVDGDARHVSDGIHTFDELYRHRCYLFSCLMRKFGGRAWKSFRHDDDSFREGQFIAGIALPTGESVTYHMPEKFWPMLHGIKELPIAPKWDGHNSKDVLKRLEEWLFHDIR